MKMENNKIINQINKKYIKPQGSIQLNKEFTKRLKPSLMFVIKIQIIQLSFDLNNLRLKILL